MLDFVARHFLLLFLSCFGSLQSEVHASRRGVPVDNSEVQKLAPKYCLAKFRFWGSVEYLPQAKMYFSSSVNECTAFKTKTGLVTARHCLPHIDEKIAQDAVEKSWSELSSAEKSLFSRLKRPAEVRIDFDVELSCGANYDEKSRRWREKDSKSTEHRILAAKLFSVGPPARAKVPPQVINHSTSSPVSPEVGIDVVVLKVSNWDKVLAPKEKDFFRLPQTTSEVTRLLKRGNCIGGGFGAAQAETSSAKNGDVTFVEIDHNLRLGRIGKLIPNPTFEDQFIIPGRDLLLLGGDSGSPIICENIRGEWVPVGVASTTFIEKTFGNGGSASRFQIRDQSRGFSIAESLGRVLRSNKMYVLQLSEIRFSMFLETYGK